jgi:hypothetical protein
MPSPAKKNEEEKSYVLTRIVSFPDILLENNACLAARKCTGCGHSTPDRANEIS